MRSDDVEIEKLPLQLVGRLLPALVVRPRVAPHVELQQVDRFDPEIAQAFFCVATDMVGRKHIVQRILGARRPSITILTGGGRLSPLLSVPPAQSKAFGQIGQEREQEGEQEEELGLLAGVDDPVVAL